MLAIYLGMLLEANDDVRGFAALVGLARRFSLPNLVGGEESGRQTNLSHSTNETWRVIRE